jgi:hypothetical protein
VRSGCEISFLAERKSINFISLPFWQQNRQQKYKRQGQGLQRPTAWAQRQLDVSEHAQIPEYFAQKSMRIVFHPVSSPVLSPSDF